MFKEDWRMGLNIQANTDYIDAFSYLPIPGISGSAAFASEVRDIYQGRQTFGGAAFDVVAGMVAGKAGIYVVKHTENGMKYVWQGLKAYNTRNNKLSLDPNRIVETAQWVAQTTALGTGAILAKDQIDTYYKKKHGNQHKKPFSSQGAQTGGQTDTSAGGMPNPDHDPRDKNGKSQKGRRLPPEERIGLKHKFPKDGQQVKKYDLSKYTKKSFENGQKVRINPETGDKVVKDIAGHGGGAWKKILRNGDKETLDKDGFVIRVNKLKL
jgi:hypothetical protein